MGGAPPPYPGRRTWAGEGGGGEEGREGKEGKGGEEVGKEGGGWCGQKVGESRKVH